ncbi:NAD P-binding protein [Gloeophyllum trabeum ATCC 11539]|uniref:NAD P-binding protein n=1 Tax=Gloeophyllum trabeum (strain ATCC 11539 / FP-39264 / Madison 617) TaxID=670483 RepID=S7PTX8_GLOTA|nr:NAD P-binding protein [Gloeophyllum trabeum ATCC 11539]EPQ51261.1 NAD P-binding protein [Gloeophyllum trabeum ATCC 11539]
MSTSESDQKVWFITGTSSGFGRRLVKLVLERGDLVIATARNLAKIQEPAFFDLASDAHTSSLRVLQLDIDSGVENLKEVVKEGMQFWGRIDVLVNNAAWAQQGLLEEAGSDLVRRIFQSNVFSMLDVTTAVLPYMRERRSGTIVVIGSRTSWMPENPSGGTFFGLYRGICRADASRKAYMPPQSPPYECVLAIGETLSVELASFNIRVLIVEPGAFRTEGIFAQPFFLENQIPDYDELRASSQAFYNSINGTQKGDPTKAMRAVVDVVRGEGRATGKAWPLYLPLGIAAEKTIREKCERMTGVLEEWKDVIRDVNFDQ